MTKIKCPICETTNLSDRKECSHCGAPLPKVRVSGGEPVRAGGAGGQQGQPGSGGQGSGGQQGAPGNQGQAVSGQATFRKGQLVANRYTIVDVVGKGGMGCIYRVYDNTLKEQVALKTLLPQYLRDKMVVDRFFNEARIARQLSHPNIVRVHDIGVADQMLYISMEFMQGKSLRGALEELLPGERFPLQDGLRVMIDLCTALEYAHQYTIHRDLKPENIMILPDGSVKLMDFGISKLMSTNKLTATAVVMGTPHYMPPEQFRDSSTVDARADIYSIGVIIYEMLTGNLPTGVSKPASQIKSDIPPALDPIIGKCVEPDPAQRYATVTELKQALQDVLTIVRGGTLEAKKKQKASLAPDAETTRSIIGWALIAAVVVLTAVGIWGMDKARKEKIAIAAAATVDAPAAVAQADPLAETFAVLQAARDAVATMERKEGVQAILDRGAQFYDVAEQQREKNPEFAYRAAQQSLQCYLALRSPLRDTAIFVAPKENEDGFFMARAPVTVGEFIDWSRANQWRELAPPDPEVRELPVNNVCFYDAQAYAADHGMRVPSRMEWERAREVDAMALASGIYEWTRDVANGKVNEDGLPTFGSVMTTVSLAAEEQEAAEGEEPVVNLLPPQVAQWDYAQGNEQLGFRCAIPIPATPEEARKLLGI